MSEKGNVLDATSEVTVNRSDYYNPRGRGSMRGSRRGAPPRPEVIPPAITQPQYGVSRGRGGYF